MTQTDYDLFPELATTIFYFIEKLHNVLTEQGVEQVYFLSREGQPLMRMFDMYRDRVNGRIKSIYLEVSRRSTLLPSLSPLSEENFETLFRQYQKISLLGFLASLGLEAHTKSVAQTLGLPDGAEARREENFPSSPIYLSLKTLPLFQDLYEAERLARREAFITYLTELSAENLPTTLVIVDVGWKGTIQDNLYSLLCLNSDTPVRKVTGYYAGLVADGSSGPNNDKYGLLFSSVKTPSPGYYVLNENRALFEIMLAADHGSIVSYETTANGHACAIQGEFEENEMLEAEVFPIQRQLFRHFDQLVAAIPPTGNKHKFTLKEVVQAHARMVFNPTKCERMWFSSVYHIENYGVFERSTFAVPPTKLGLLQRLKFLYLILLRRESGVLGFWPWKTIYERGGGIPARIYATIRQLQCYRRSK